MLIILTKIRLYVKVLSENYLAEAKLRLFLQTQFINLCLRNLTKHNLSFYLIIFYP